jgi:hypothetical protein
MQTQLTVLTAEADAALRNRELLRAIEWRRLHPEPLVARRSLPGRLLGAARRHRKVALAS